MVFELCTSDIHSVEIAEKNNLAAIELCVQLENGGLTPSFAFIEKARHIFSGEMAVFFRPRNGDFTYDTHEQQLILKDIQLSLSLGVDTLVAGGLLPDGNLDIEFMKKIIDHSMGHTICFHRAFDVCPNPKKLLDELIHLQIDRLLTSGREKDALTGAKQINSLIEWSSHKIEIMAGGGLHAGNINEFLNVCKVTRFHASLRKPKNPIPGIMDLGNAEVADEQEVKQMVTILKSRQHTP